jgi:hypothetical protein
MSRITACIAGRLTMRLSDAGLRCSQTKLIYPNHRLPPWLIVQQFSGYTCTP